MTLPDFEMTMDGGVLKPLINAGHRFGRNAIIEVDHAGISVMTGGFHHVRFRIDADDMLDYGVEQPGEGSFNIDDAWSQVGDFNFSDEIRVWTSFGTLDRIHFGSEGRITLRELEPDDAIDVDVPSFDARFDTDASDFQDFARAFSAVNGNLTVAFGFDQETGTGFGVVEDVGPGDDELRAALPVEARGRGDAVTAVLTNNLRSVAIPIPRPSGKALSVHVEDEGAILFEYPVDGVTVEVLVRGQSMEDVRGFDLRPPEAPREPEAVGVPEDFGRTIEGTFDEEIIEAGEMEEVEAEPEPEAPTFTAGQVETIVEGATQGVTVNAIVRGRETGPDIREIRLMRDSGSPVVLSEERVNVISSFDDTDDDMILRAIVRWEEFVAMDTVDAEALNEARSALRRQFDLDIPPVVRDIEPPERVEPEPEPDPTPDVTVEPAILPSEQATADAIELAFPAVHESTGSLLEDRFDTIQDILDAPANDILDVYGIGDGTVKRMIERPDFDADLSIGQQRDPPLGLSAEDVARPQVPAIERVELAVVVGDVAGDIVYQVPNAQPELAQAIRDAARDVLGSAKQFEMNDPVGTVILENGRILNIDFDAGLDLLNGGTNGPPVDIGSQLFSKLKTAMLRANFPVVTPPARLFRDEGRIVAEPVVTDDWAIHLDRDPPRLVQPRDVDDEAFLMFYLEELVTNMPSDTRAGINLDEAEEVLAMAPPESPNMPDVRDVEEVESMVKDAIGGDQADPPVADDRVTEPDRDGDAEQFMQRMIDQDNRVLRSNLQWPTIEVIVPNWMKDKVFELFDRHDINPAGFDVGAQAPSFAEQRPDVAADMASFQVMLGEPPDNIEPDDPKASGYDLEAIFEELDDELATATKAPAVEWTLPWE